MDEGSASGCGITVGSCVNMTGRERYGLEMAADGLLCFRTALDKGLWE